MAPSLLQPGGVGPRACNRVSTVPPDRSGRRRAARSLGGGKLQQNVLAAVPQAPGWWPHFPTLTRRRGLPHRSECGVWENPAGLRQCAMVQTRAGEPLGTLTDSSFTRQNSRSASPSQLGAADCRFRSRSQQVILEITVPAADQLSFALTIRGYRRLGSTQHCAQ